MNPVLTIVTGAIAGWLSSIIYKRSSLGILGNIFVGILGGYIGYWFFRQLGIFFGTGMISAIIRGAIGAIVILFFFNLIFKKR